MPRYNDAVLADLDEKVKELSGEHYETLKAEFVDWNDARVGTLREYMDLGVPREVAESVLLYLREVANMIWPDLKARYADSVFVPVEEPVEELVEA